ESLAARGEGHRVFTSSVSSLRGMPKAQNTYGASTAFVSSLAQGMHAELDSAGSRVVVTDILPGYIRTDIHRSVKTSLMTEFDEGVDALVAANDAEPTRSLVPAKAWQAIGPLLTPLPEKISRRFV